MSVLSALHGTIASIVLYTLLFADETGLPPGGYHHLARRAGPVGIGIARLLPGVRPWATLSCGAMGIPVRRFLLGALPALLVWLVTWTALGILLAQPVAHFLGVFHRLLLRGILLLVVGVAGYISLHRLQRRGLVIEQRRLLWLPLTLLITGGTIASIVAGVLAIGRGLVEDDGAVWLDALLVAVVLTIVAGIAVLKDRSRPGGPPAAAS